MIVSTEKVSTMSKMIYEFGSTNKLIALTKLCIKDTKYRARTQNLTPGTFTVKAGLKQGDSLSPVVFDIALKKIVTILQEHDGGLFINQNKKRLVRFAYDLDIIGESFADTANADRVLEEVAKQIVGHKINSKKTNIMELYYI